MNSEVFPIHARWLPHAKIRSRAGVDPDVRCVAERGWYKVKLTDGMRDSVKNALGWSTDPSQTANRTAWVKVDLGAVCRVGRVDLYPSSTGAGFPTNFTIQISSDNLAWTTVVTKTAYPQPTDGLVRTFPVAPRNARWVKVTAPDARTMSLAETEVYD
jgi:hypothetical protein